jgi:hypothetical protein
MTVVQSSAIAQNIPAHSTLPLFVIDTDSVEIPDEPKIISKLTVIYDASGGLNYADSDEYHYNGFAGIELRGKSSQSFDKKSFGIELRKDSGADRNFELLGLPKEADWVLHGPYSDKSLMRNAVAYTLAGKLMEYAPRVRFIELIINDDYKGVYLLTEKIKRDRNRVNINNLNADETEGDALTGGYIFKLDKIDQGEFNASIASQYDPYPGSSQEIRYIIHDPKPEDLQAEQYAYLKSTIERFENTFLVDDISDPVIGYPSKIDVQSFVDYFLINELCKNQDAYRLSTYFYKDRDSINSLIKIGPVWDFNISMGNVNYCVGSSYDGWVYPYFTYCPDDFWQVPFYWQVLLEDLSFRKAVRERWITLRLNELSNASVLGMIDSLESTLAGGPVIRNFLRWSILDEWVWPNDFVGGNYQSELQFLKSWLANRLAWMDAQIYIFDDQAYNPDDAFDPILYPNPVTSGEQLTVRGYWNKGLKTTITMYDLQGRMIGQSHTVFRVNGVSEWFIPLPKYTGIIFYEMTQDKRIISNGKIFIHE